MESIESDELISQSFIHIEQLESFFRLILDVCDSSIEIAIERMISMGLILMNGKSYWNVILAIGYQRHLYFNALPDRISIARH